MTKQYTFSEFVTRSYDIRRTITLTEDELKSIGINPDDITEDLGLADYSQITDSFESIPDLWWVEDADTNDETVYDWTIEIEETDV